MAHATDLEDDERLAEHIHNSVDDLNLLFAEAYKRDVKVEVHATEITHYGNPDGQPYLQVTVLRQLARKHRCPVEKQT